MKRHVEYMVRKENDYPVNADTLHSLSEAVQFVEDYAHDYPGIYKIVRIATEEEKCITMVAGDGETRCMP